MPACHPRVIMVQKVLDGALFFRGFCQQDQRPILGLLLLIQCPVLRFVSSDETGSKDSDGHGPVQQVLVLGSASGHSVSPHMWG